MGKEIEIPAGALVRVIDRADIPTSGWAIRGVTLYRDGRALGSIRLMRALMSETEFDSVSLDGRRVALPESYVLTLA